MILINDKSLFKEDGTLLKTMSCPKNMDKNSLLAEGRNHLCKECHEKVINTDYLTEYALIDLLEEDSSICLSVNTLNPIFKEVSKL